MTRPSDVKIPEGRFPGTPWKDFELDASLPDLRFTLTPDVIDEYRRAIEGDTHELDGRPVAQPMVLAVYLLAILYAKYPPAQGIILTEQKWRWHHPLYVDEDTELRGTGRIVEKFEKGGKKFMRWQGEFYRADGMKIATAENSMFLPE